MNRHKRRRGERASALWGTGTRGGDSRGSALWGKGGRAAPLIGALVSMLVIPWAASANHGSWQYSGSAFVPAALVQQAQDSPQQVFPLIIQGDAGSDAARTAHLVAVFAAQADDNLANSVQQADRAAQAAQQNLAKTKGNAATVAAQKLADQAAAAATSAHATLDSAADKILQQQVEDQFSSIHGVEVQLTGKQLLTILHHTDGSHSGLLSITPNVQVQATGKVKLSWSNFQLWPYASGEAANWSGDQTVETEGKQPTIAIVDSGIDARSELFGQRVVASVNLSTLPNNSPGDGRGHGTFVAGMAAASLKGLSGATPVAKLVSLDVMDDSGMGMTGDIIRACQWILDNKDKYNIRVANFSLHSTITAPFYVDPLDRAVEQLWFNGVTVVAAAGNYGVSGSPSGVVYSPGNDPFVITVGAADINGSLALSDDTVAPWSAWGPTIDGFAKPELSAPGRYLVGPVSTASTLALERPANVVYPGYMELSGTSFAAPVVAGAAADILAKHPEFTPDQVKGALMLTARPMSSTVGSSGGVGELGADAAVLVTNPPNPNLGLDQFVAPAADGSGPAFDAVSWNSAAQANASWNSVSWNSASWNSASWNSVSWNSVSWNSASWNSVSWNSVSWNDASWNSVSWNSASHEDAAGGDVTGGAAILGARDLAALDLTPEDISVPWLSVPSIKKAHP